MRNKIDNEISRRLFIAIATESNRNFDSCCRKIETDIKQYISGKEHTKHVTLVFIGETDEEKIPLIKQIMDEQAAKTSRFQLKFNELGIFENGKKEKPLFFKPQEAPSLNVLNANLKTALEKAGVISSNVYGFTPHLTLVKYEISNEKQVREYVVDQNRKQKFAFEFDVREIVLYETVSGKNKKNVVYTVTLPA